MASCPVCYCGGGCSEKKEEPATPSMELTELKLAAVFEKVAGLFDKVEKVRLSNLLATIHTHTRPLVCLNQLFSHGPTSPRRPTSRSTVPCGWDQPTKTYATWLTTLHMLASPLPICPAGGGGDHGLPDGHRDRHPRPTRERGLRPRSVHIPTDPYRYNVVCVYCYDTLHRLTTYSLWRSVVSISPHPSNSRQVGASPSPKPSTGPPHQPPQG